MRKNSQNLLLAIKNNTYEFHLTDIDNNVLSKEDEIDSYFLELVNEGYYKSFRKEYIKNSAGRIYKINYIVGD